MILLMLFATCGVINLQGDFMTEDSWYYDTLLIRDGDFNSFTYISEDKYFDLTNDIESYEIIDNAFNDTLYFWTDNHPHTELPDRTMYYDSETNEYLDVVPEDIIITLGVGTDYYFRGDSLIFSIVEESGSIDYDNIYIDPTFGLSAEGEITFKLQQTALAKETRVWYKRQLNLKVGEFLVSLLVSAFVIVGALAHLRKHKK